MGQNSVDYHMGRVHCLVWCVVVSVFAYFCLQLLMSAELRAGTVEIARLRFLNSLPFEGRILVVSVVLGLVVVMAGGIAFRIFETRAYTIDDDGIEFVSLFSRQRARWRDFTKVRRVLFTGMKVLAFKQPDDGSTGAKSIPLPSGLFGIDTKAFLTDAMTRVALHTLSGSLGRAPRAQEAKVLPVLANVVVQIAQQRKGFGRRRL
jgi:hypothetical protein